VVKVTTIGSNLGFIDQSASGRVPYSGFLKNGTATGTATSGGTLFTLSPLTAGATTSVTGTASPGGSASGTATLTADGDFFFANLTGAGSAGDQIFVFGGVPVQQSFYAPTANAQFLSFQVQPDAALASSTSAQTIPFLPSFAGGTMANANVSPFYVVTAPNVPFGAFNILTNDNPALIAPKWLQASLAINGQGANQTSAFVVGNGSFVTSSDNGQVVVSGIIRGLVSQSATSPYTWIFASAHSVPDANGNSLFGGNTLSGFVLDQNNNSITDNFVPDLASVSQFGQSANTSYAFNQPVTSTGTFTPGTRSALNETGYFGGLMIRSSNLTLTGNPYVLTGATAVQTDPASDRVAATFAGTDPFTPSQSGITSMVLQFGSLPSSSPLNYSRSVFVDNNTFAALESPITPSQINGNNLPVLTTVSNPSTLAPGAQPVGSSLPNLTPSLAMVTVGTLGPNANSWMPAGVTPCACQYLQWGYWTGQVITPNSSLTAISRDDRAFINTWLAGQPTVNMPTTGSGSYNGAAVGTVFNNGATYLAAGAFKQTYNFASQTGTINLTNFDGANYAAAVSGSGGIYSGSLTGTPNRSGAVVGSFFGPGAVETGGTFSIQSTAGARYLASGIFAGR
jgi:hypothetical protein